jgi:hypothetical protein
MNAAVGHTGVLLALVAALVGAGVVACGLARRRPGLLRAGRIYAALILVGAVVATVAMERALITHDFSIAFVAANNSRETPLLYTVTGLWSALAGSILLWGLILSGYIAAMVWRFRRRSDDPLVACATLVTFLVAAFFFALMAGPADPFRTVAGAAPPDGVGPNVLLQDNPLVAFHPPLLYLGFVGFTVPFAFAVASLATGRVGVVPGARVGRLLGVGPRRERVVAPLAVRHRIPPLGAGPGATGSVAGVEPVVGHRHLQLDHPGHIPHTLGGHRVRARLLGLRHRAAPARILRRRPGGGRGPHRLSR